MGREGLAGGEMKMGRKKEDEGREKIYKREKREDVKGVDEGRKGGEDEIRKRGRGWQEGMIVMWRKKGEQESKGRMQEGWRKGKKEGKK